MPHTSRLPYLSLRCFAVIFSIAATFISGTALAQSIPSSGDTYSCTLLATSLDYPYGPTTGTSNPYGPYIYDDANTNFGGGGDNGRWNCSREFLITEYTNTDITFDFDYGGSYYDGYGVLHPPVSSHTIKVYNNGTLVHTFPFYPDKTGSGTDNLFVLSSPYDTTPGEYSIEYWRDDSGVTTQPDITGRFVLQPQIQKIWIEISPICSSYSTDTFKFQVHSIPELSTIIQPSHYYGFQPCDADNIAFENVITIDFPGLFSFSTPAIGQFWDYSDWGAYPGEVPGDGWAAALATYTSTYETPLDLNDYYILYGSPSDGTSLASFIDPTGVNYGTPPVITLTFSDGIATMLADTVPIIIQYPAIPASSYLPSATTGPAPYGPPNAIGVPWPSYDIYKYVVSGTEVWTPTNNPITQMRGGGGVDSVIRIQDSLIIPAGAELGLEGMAVQMGPKAGIMVGNAAGGGTGGYLDLYYSRVTAYRGCAGTDTSTWGGLTIAGDTSISEAGTYWPNPNARLVWTASSISYADVGWANGTGGASAGGEIESFGNDTFYNNRLDVQFWPYRNVESGVEGEADDIFSYDAFVYDANAWFPKNYFVNIIGAWPAEFYSCNFANNSGNTVYAGINGLEAGLYIAGCTFTNFNHAVYASYITGTHTAHIGGIFTNNHSGVWINGCIASTINGSIFNIPAYTGSTPYFYPGAGTSAIVDSDQSVGVLVNGSAGYNITGNTFQGITYAPTWVTGTLQYNTGSDNNQVTNNNFNFLGTAMLSNFVNNSHTSGLQYLCNTDSLVGFDFSVLGDGSGIGGINPVQATSSSSGHYDLPSGNIFKHLSYTVFDLQDSLTYKWYSLDPTETPASVSANVYTVSVASPAQCYAVSGSGPFTLTEFAGERYAGTDVALNYAVAAANVNYYMMDLGGTHQRDSIYYWAGQMSTAYGDLLITNLLIEDNYIDSANTIYNNIITKYSLDSIEANEFTQGRNLENIIVSHHINGTTLFSLSEGEVATLQSVKANTTMWAHARAENWLFSFDGEPLTDTLLYPNPTDTAGRRSYHPVQPTVIGMKSNNAIYPNPVHDVLQVMYTALQADETITLEITDVSGKTVITQTLQSGVQVGINVSSLVPGTYLYRISENTKVTMSGKITKD